MPRYPLGIMGKKRFRVCPWIWNTVCSAILSSSVQPNWDIHIAFWLFCQIDLCAASTSPNPKVDNAIWLFCQVAKWSVQKQNRSAKLLPRKNRLPLTDFFFSCRLPRAAPPPSSFPSLYFYLNLETTPIKFSNLHIKLFFFEFIKIDGSFEVQSSHFKLERSPFKIHTIYMWHPFTDCQTCLNFFFPGLCKGTSNFDHNLEVSFNLERAPLKASRTHK